MKGNNREKQRQDIEDGIIRKIDGDQVFIPTIRGHLTVSIGEILLWKALNHGGRVPAWARGDRA